MLPQLIVYVKVERNEFIIKNFKGSDDILTIVESGSFVYNDGTGEKTANRFDGVLFRKNIKYTRRIKTPVVLHLFRFKEESPFSYKNVIVFKDKRRIESTINMLGMLEKKFMADNYMNLSLVFADLINQYVIENSKSMISARTSDPIVEKVIEIIDNSFFKKIKLSEISEKVGLSYIQLSRRFKNAVGVLPFDYVSEKRLKKAEHLLINTDMTISEIAPLCGFENGYYFSNFFRKRKNISPSAFRQGL